MKLKLASGLLAALAVSAAQASLIDFERLGSFEDLTDQYADLGVNFTGATSLKSPNYNVPNYPPHSGLVVLYSPDGTISGTLDSAAKDLSFWYTTYDTSLRLDLYDGATLVGSSAVTSANIGTTTQLSASAASFDSFKIVGTGNYFTVDDLNVEAVPEPASMAALGLGALGLLRRRRK